MFLKFRSVDGLKQENGEMPSEICTFEGIRFDAEWNFAILSTEHSAHDYLMPMEKDTYTEFVEQLYTMAAMCLMRPGIMVRIEGSPLIRVKHGSMTQWDRTEQYAYSLVADRDVVERYGY